MVSTSGKVVKPFPSNRQKNSFSYLGKYISPECLVNLKKYKYSSSNRSILSHYVMHSYWDFVSGLIPMTVAPNMITLIGFLVGLSSSFILLFYYFIQNAIYPAWVWYYAAASIFFYQTMDAIDGKQARRTGTSGPLGELFDHGCDALLLPFFQVNIVLMANMPPWMMFIYFLLSSLGLFTSIWEQYSTGIFVLDYFSAPTEGIILSCVLFILTARYSTSLFDKTLLGPYHFQLPYILTAPFLKDPVSVYIGSFRSIAFSFVFVSTVWTILTSILHVVSMPTIQSSKVLCFSVALPVAALTVLHVLLYASYPTVHDAYPLTFELNFAILISFLSTRLTLSRLCGTQYPYLNLFYTLSFAVTGAFLTLHFFPLDWFTRQSIEQSLGITMIFLFIFSVLQYSHMFVSATRQFASYLNVNILSFTPRKKL